MPDTNTSFRHLPAHSKRKLTRRSRPVYRSLQTLPGSWSWRRWEFEELNMPIVGGENDLTPGISGLLRLRWWHSTLSTGSTLGRTETHWWWSHSTSIRWWSEAGLIRWWSHLLLLLLLLLVPVHELTIWGHRGVYSRWGCIGE